MVQKSEICKYSMLYDSNLCNSVAGKSQDCANSVIVSLRKHHFDGKQNTDLQIKNEIGSICVRSTFWVNRSSLVRSHQHLLIIPCNNCCRSLHHRALRPYSRGYYMCQRPCQCIREFFMIRQVIMMTHISL